MSERDFLTGKTLFITGASRGIGLAIALRAARDGANIVDRRQDRLRRIRSCPARSTPPRRRSKRQAARPCPCGATSARRSRLPTAVAQAVAAFGGIDMLVNNASAISLTDTRRRR